MVSLQTMLVSVFLCLLPISELRGGLPYALAKGVPAIPAFLLCTAANTLVGPLLYLFLGSLHRLLDRWAPYHALFERLIERSRQKVRGKIEKYGFGGLTIFIALPLPFTGAYTGALGAWVLGFRARKAFLAVACGVFLAGLIVTAVFLLGLKPLYFFIKSQPA